jgi:hypothetical protein
MEDWSPASEIPELGCVPSPSAPMERVESLRSDELVEVAQPSASSESGPAFGPSSVGTEDTSLAEPLSCRSNPVLIPSATPPRRGGRWGRVRGFLTPISLGSAACSAALATLIVGLSFPSAPVEPSPAPLPPPSSQPNQPAASQAPTHEASRPADGSELGALPPSADQALASSPPSRLGPPAGSDPGQRRRRGGSILR